ncbi:SpoIID/LytB domain-containing protein [bacterium]|nr:SpoIID/LytB domain-containing protein [bacterium]
MRRMVWACGLTACLLAGAALESFAGDIPELPAPCPSAGSVCASGPEVRVGLASADRIIVRSASGVRVNGNHVYEAWACEAAPWIGAVYGGASPASSAAYAETAPGWCLRGIDGDLQLAADVVPAGSGDVLELFRWEEDGTVGTGTAYRGSLRFIATGRGQIQPISILPLESYLSGVVPREVPASFHSQALQAMACVARSYTMSHLGQHRRQGFDLCDTVHCQVYGGLSAETSNVNEVISSSAGKVLAVSGKPIDATYHAVCGGWGDAPQNVWKGQRSQPYLQARADTVTSDRRIKKLASLGPNSADCFTVKKDRRGQEHTVLSEAEKLWRDFIDSPPGSFCQNATRFRWEQKYSNEDLLERLRQSLPQLIGIKPEALGKKLDVRVTKRSPGGRVAELQVSTELGAFALGGDKVRWITSGGRIGREGLKSSFFYVTKEQGRTVFRGCGWGHGVGLCQEGAQGRALAGQSCAKILEHYYPGASLCTVVKGNI